MSQIDSNFDVILICADGKPDEVRNNIYIKSYSNHKYSKWERFRLLVFNKKFVNYLIHLNADIYQFHDFELVEVGRVLKKKGKKVIFDSHENWSDVIPLYFHFKVGKYLGAKFIHFYYKIVLPKFDAIFSVSPNMVDRLKLYNANTFFVSNYPSIKNIKSNDSIDKENSFIYQGTVYEYSNQDVIVKALSLVSSDTKYRIVGSISDRLKESILNLDKKNRVEILGWIEKEELDTIMKSSLCGIVILDYVPFCCDKEGQLGSNKIFEYMTCGLPIICTDFILWKELIIDKYNCGICVDPNNIEQIKNAMEWLINNQNEAIQMGVRGYNAIINEFNWEKQLNHYISIYKNIFNEKLNS